MNKNIQKEIVEFLKIRHYLLEDKQWERIENNIIAKLSDFYVPDSVFQKMAVAVKDLGKSLLNWIDYQDSYIFSHCNSSVSAVDLINSITWTVRGKIDYEQTAKNILANQNTLLNDQTKLILACNYCFEDEIKLLAPKAKNIFDYMDANSDPMVYFWKSRITKDIKLNGQNNNISFNEYIMQCLINSYRGHARRSLNVVPIRFMWNRLSEEEKENNIASLVEHLGIDSVLSSLSNICYDLQQKVLKKSYFHLLENLFNDWLWGEYYLPTTFIVLESLEFDNPLEYWGVLIDTIYDKYIKSKEMKNYMCYEYKLIFKQLLREASIQFKDFILPHKDLIIIEFFLAYQLSWEEDSDIAEVMLEELNAEQKKNIIFGKDAVERCIRFIINEHWDLLELFIKYTLSTKEDISLLKKKITRDVQMQFAPRFSTCKSPYKVERFLKWAFESEEEREEYKQNFKKNTVYKLF